MVIGDKWIAPLRVNGALVPLKLEAFGKANLISVSDIKAPKEKTRKSLVVLKDYNGRTVDSLGTCGLKVTIKHITCFSLLMLKNWIHC